MPWIQNVSLDDLVKGHHFDPGSNTILIQIVDPDMEFPTPLYHFREVYQLKFLDIEEAHQMGPSVQDAEAICAYLASALDRNMNVVVHCVAGICRSGAVVEVGTIMGFSDPEVYRCPNTRLKKLMMTDLGLTYDSTEGQIEKWKVRPWGGDTWL